MKYILIVSILFSNLQLFSQSADDIGKIALHVVLPEEYSPNFENLGPRELKKIKSKITSIASRNGVAGAGLGNFVIYPVLNIYEEEVLEGGLEHQTIIRAEFSLFIQQISNGQIYGEATIDLEGFGRDRSRALSRAIQGINIRDRAWKAMINESKQKIIDYYELRCSDIQVEAEGKSKTEDYLGALITLMQVPVEVGCYREIVNRAVEFYDYHIELECQQKIAAAKVLKTQDKWDQAAGLLFGILPHYGCYNSATLVLKEIEDHRCSVDLGKAKGAWSRGEEGAMEAAKYLAMVPSDSKCAEEANKISDEIKSRLEHLDQRDWDLQYEKYNRDKTLQEDDFNRRMAMREDSQEHRQEMQKEDQSIKKDAQSHDQYMKEREQDTKDNAIANDGAVIQDGETSIITSKVDRMKDLIASVFSSKSESGASKINKNTYNYYTGNKKK